MCLLRSTRVRWRTEHAGTHSAVCFGFSFLLPRLARALGRKHTHSVCLLCGALGLVSVVFTHSKWALLGSMLGVGIA